MEAEEDLRKQGISSRIQKALKRIMRADVDGKAHPELRCVFVAYASSYDL
jgi:hypothetical protein